jgi:hypothetical protein
VSGRLLVFAICGALLLQTSSASAEESDGGRERAAVAFEQGMAALNDGDRERAVEAFARSYELLPHPGTLLNLALCQQELGRVLLAHHSFTELLDRFGGVISARASEQARAGLDVSLAQLARITIAGLPAGARLSIDGAEVGRAPFDAALVLEPGRHELAAEREGFTATEETRELEAGAIVELAFELTPIEPELPEPVVEPTPEPAEPRRSFWRRPWPWIILGVVVVGAGVGLGVGLTRDDSNEYDWNPTFP